MPQVSKINDEKLVREMYENGISISDIASHFGVSFAPMQRFFKKHHIRTRTLKEAKKESKKTLVGLKKWRQKNGSWNKGLSKADPRVKKNIESGRLTQIKNEKNKGPNNPMYGKTPKWKAGFRKDLGHFVRSSWEANFCRILKHLGIQYEYETKTFPLQNGETYTPDFYLPNKNRYYEIKGYNYNDKYARFANENNAKLTLIDERYYSRLIKHFSHFLKLEDEKSFFTRDDLLNSYKRYVEETTNRSVKRFCKIYNLSVKTIRRIFGSETAFKNSI